MVDDSMIFLLFSVFLTEIIDGIPLIRLRAQLMGMPNQVDIVHRNKDLVWIQLLQLDKHQVSNVQKEK